MYDSCLIFLSVVQPLNKTLLETKLYVETQ